MKKVILLLTCAALTVVNVFAQQVIKANNATNHIGEQVVIVDSICNIKIYNDSTAVIDLGGKDMKACLNIVFDFNSKCKFDAKFVKDFKESKIVVSGYVVLVDGQPAIVVTEKEKLKFLSSTADQKWLAMSNIPYDRNRN